MQRVLQALANRAALEPWRGICLRWKQFVELLGLTALIQEKSSQTKLLLVTQRIFWFVGAALLVAYLLIAAAGLASSGRDDESPPALSINLKLHQHEFEQNDSPMNKGNFQTVQLVSSQSSHYKTINTELANAAETREIGSVNLLESGGSIALFPNSVDWP